MKNQRNSGVELLRILAMIGVIMIHYFEAIINFEIDYSSTVLLIFLRSLCAYSVDLFIIITGYFLINNEERKMGKAISLLIQVSLFSEVNYLLYVACGIYNLSLKSIISSFISKNYFVTLYIVLYVLSPYINRLIKSLNMRDLRIMLCILFSIFSIYSISITFYSEIVNVKWFGLSPVGAWGSQQGFNIVNFVLLYSIGAFIRLANYDLIVKQKQCFAIFISCTLIVFVWALVNQHLPQFGQISSWCYDNPFVIIQGASLFIIFKKMSFSSSIINRLAASAFTVFLIHYMALSKLSSIILFDNMSSEVIIFRFICFAIIIYLFSWVVYEIYNYVTKSIFTRIDNIIQINYFTK